MTFLYANRLKLCMRIDFNVGDSNCRRNDVDVCESTKVVSAKRPRCMRINLYAKRPTSGVKKTKATVSDFVVVAAEVRLQVSIS